MKKLLIILICSLLIDKSKAQILFENNEVLACTLEMPIKTVIRDLDERDQHKAKFWYENEQGNAEIHEMKVEVRGNNRSNPNVCGFPPLKLDFKKKKVAGTLMHGQNKLKLVTHCNRSRRETDYLLQEYYVYKMYEIITPYSLKTRLCQITYNDSNEEEDPFTRYGILIEDIDDLADRHYAKETEDSILNQAICDQVQLDNFIFFQYLIGNHDWSVPYMHNVKMIKKSDQAKPIPIPYDFDYAGIVEKPYAAPPEN